MLDTCPEAIKDLEASERWGWQSLRRSRQSVGAAALAMTQADLVGVSVLGELVQTKPSPSTEHPPQFWQTGGCASWRAVSASPSSAQKAFFTSCFRAFLGLQVQMTDPLCPSVFPKEGEVEQ